MQISISNNEEVYEKLKGEDSKMSNALENLMKDRLEKLMEDVITSRVKKSFAEGRAEGQNEGRIEGIRSILEKLTESGKLSAQEASLLMAEV